MGLVASLLIMAIIQSLLEFIVKLILSVTDLIMVDSLTVFKSGTNFFEQILSTISPTFTFDVTHFMFTLSTIILVMLLLKSGIRSLNSSVDNGETNPFDTVARAFIAYATVIILYGTGGNILNWNGLLADIGKLCSELLNMIYPEALMFSKDFVASAPVLTFTEPIAMILTFILSISLIINVFKAAITYVERIVTYAFTFLMGPVAIVCYASNDTEEIAIKWGKSMVSQFLAVIMSLALWSMIHSQINTLYSTALFESISFATGKDVLRYLLAIALCIIMNKSEDILNSYGITTIANKQMGSSVVQSAMLTINSLSNLAKSGIGAYSRQQLNLENDKKKAMENLANAEAKNDLNLAAGGQSRSIYGTDNYNASTYNASQNGKSYANSSYQQNANQYANSNDFVNSKVDTNPAYSNLQNAVNNMSNGDVLVGNEFGNGAEQVNDMLNHNVPEQENGIVVSQHNGINNVQMSNRDSNHIVKGTATTTDGKNVSGVIGNGFHQARREGVTPQEEKIFVPTNYGDAKQENLTFGSSLNAGGKQYRIGTDAYTIDQQGHKAYSVMTEDDFQALQATKKGESSHSYKKSDISTSTGGRINANNNGNNNDSKKKRTLIGTVDYE